RSAARAEPQWSDEVEAEDEPVTPRGQVLDLSPRPGGPAVEVRCLGGFDVIAGQDDLTAAASPSEAAERAGAWELLAFLACAPEGVASREDVLNALWPRLDGRQANAALQGTIERLNTLLQPAVQHVEATTPPARLDTRDGTVRLDLQRVESDVHRFVRLSHAAALMQADAALDTWERARQLYRGDLLD